MILYRPVGLQELALIYASGMKAFPTRLPQQPIFYPVLDLAYARQTASSWNAHNGEFAGYVTEFKVDDEYIAEFEEHTVGESPYRELWIPTEEMDEFNRHIVGHIKVVEAYFGKQFQGFVPEQFGLKGKNAVEQFNVLANSFLYKRMDFYLEIKRNHQAVFLNYPFWPGYDFKNPGLKEKVLQAIREAWLTSFPGTPLPLPPALHEDALPLKQTPSSVQRFVHPDDKEIASQQQIDSRLPLDADEESPPEEEIEPDRQVSPVQEIKPANRTDTPANARRWLQPPHDGDGEPDPDTYSTPGLGPVDGGFNPVEGAESHAHPLVRAPHDQTLPGPSDSHFVRGVRLGLGGRYREAIAELSAAVEETPDDVVAQTSLGVAFRRAGEGDQALACFETALKIDPICAEAHYFRADILYQYGDVREAIAGYTIAIGLQPELIEAHRESPAQDRLTNYSGAPAEMPWIARSAHRILDLSKTVAMHPRQADLFKERAAHYHRLRNYTQAIADYTAALALRPGDAQALHLRGVAYEQLGQRERALEDYQRAIAIHPQLSTEYIDRGVTFGQAGNSRQSIASLTQAIRLAPNNPDSYFNRGIGYLRQGDLASAIEDFSSVIRLSPGDEEAYYWRGISHEEAGRRSEAIADYRQFLALSQDPAARAQVEQKLSQWDAGERDHAGNSRPIADRSPKANAVSPGKQAQALDLHGLIVALGRRALSSTWFGSGVESYGEKAGKLHALTTADKPIQGRELLDIASGIRQTVRGDFQAFDAGAQSPWIFLRAWEGEGFYLETDDPTIRRRLRSHFPAAEEVEGAAPPYEGIFIRI